MPTLPRQMTQACVALISGTVFSVIWIDQPLSLWLRGNGFGRTFFSSSQVQIQVMIYLGWSGLTLGLVYLIAGWKRSRWVEVAMLAGTALLFGTWATHEVFKPLFGRTVPGAALRVGWYGFHLFHGGERSDAFPSGHTTQLAAILVVVWTYYPRWKWLYGGLSFGLTVALLLGQWHFLGDTLAGDLVGIVVGLIVLEGWRWMSVRWPNQAN